MAHHHFVEIAVVDTTCVRVCVTHPAIVSSSLKVFAESSVGGFPGEWKPQFLCVLVLVAHRNANVPLRHLLFIYFFCLCNSQSLSPSGRPGQSHGQKGHEGLSAALLLSY